MRLRSLLLRRGRVALTLGGLLALSGGCSSGPTPEPAPDPAQGAPRLALFGFVGVGCGVDYSDEVEGFTNVATACAPDPALAGLVAEQLDRYRGRGLRALLNLEGLFFEPDPSGALAPYGGPRLVLREDHRQRWDALVAGADLRAREATLAAAFVADEPTWRGVEPEALRTAYAAVAATLPGTPLLLVEAYPVLEQLVVPEAVDWVAFDRYGVLDPARDPAYLSDLATLKGRRSRPGQRLLLIMEAQWLPVYAEYGVEPGAMAGVAESYYRLAQRDTTVIGLVGYLWAGGPDGPGQLGARELPADVRAAYTRIGLDILQAP